MESGASSEPQFRLRLVPGSRPPVPAAAGSPVQARRPATASRIEVTVRGRTAAVPDPCGDGLVPSAVALLRTLFEDHHADPDRAECRFFHNHLIATSSGRLDFSVTHRGDVVFLSEFTAPPLRRLPPVSVPLLTYSRQVVALARAARKLPPPAHLPPWARAQHQEQRRDLATLLDLAERLVADGARNRERFREAYEAAHGWRRRCLDLEVLRVVTEGDPPPYPVGEDALPLAAPAPLITPAPSAASAVAAPPAAAPPGPAPDPLAAEGGRPAVPATATIPWVVECRLRFGPIAAGELVPLRVNGGDVAVARVLRFSGRGPVLALWGISAGGLRPGDRLVGLQTFYP